MRTALPAILIAIVTVSACTTVRESRLNPANWFGNSTEVVVADTTEPDEVNPLIPQRAGFLEQLRRREEVYLGEPIDEVRQIVVERVPGGAIIRATGVSSYQGIYSVSLRPEFEGEDIAVDGVLTYRLDGRRPENFVTGGPERLRTVTAARAVTDQQLRGVRIIRVEGARNAQESRRR